MIIRENTKEKISNAQSVAKILSAILKTEDRIDREKEHFWVIGLTTKNTVKFVDLVTLGTLTNTIVHPREVFRLAVLKGVASIIAGHNHPSGNHDPSEDDLMITKRLKEAGKILGIELLDHVIIGNNGGFVSLKEKGVI